MSDLRDLYQEVILDHGKNPRGCRAMEDADRHADGHNPLCGDKLSVHLEVDDEGNVRDVRFFGKGCAISTASASLMTEFVKGRSRAEIEEAFERFHELVTGNPSEHVDGVGLGKLAVFSGVREFPMRVKCATLSWHTAKGALDGAGEPVTTE